MVKFIYAIGVDIYSAFSHPRVFIPPKCLRTPQRYITHHLENLNILEGSHPHPRYESFNFQEPNPWVHTTHSRTESFQRETSRKKHRQKMDENGRAEKTVFKVWDQKLGGGGEI